MNNFTYYNPVKVQFGKGQIQSLKDMIAKDKKILLTFGGGSIKKNGVYDQVMQALSEHTVIEFGGIEPNPKYETLMSAVAIAKEEKIDFLLAVGGGSVVDGTKFISAAIHHPTEAWNLLAKKEAIIDTTPFGCVMTLPATGSEMNGFAVVSKGEEKLAFGGDPRLFAQFAILDPEVTYSLPERQLGNGIVDAYVHVLEQYLTQDINTPMQDYFAQGILKTLLREGRKVIELKDYDSRANFMWAAANALSGMIGSGVVHDWSTHMIGHEITALHGVDHARTLACVLPSMLRFQKEHKRHKLLQYAHEVLDIKLATPEETIEAAIVATEDFFNSVGLPTKLKVYGITEDNISTIVEAVKAHHPYPLSENKNINPEEISLILTNAL